MGVRSEGYTQRTYADKIVDVLVVMQKQIPMIQKVQKTAESVEIQFIDTLTDAPVAMRSHVSMVMSVMKHFEWVGFWTLTNDVDLLVFLNRSG